MGSSVLALPALACSVSWHSTSAGHVGAQAAACPAYRVLWFQGEGVKEGGGGVRRLLEQLHHRRLPD